MNKHTPKRRQIVYCDTGIARKTWCGPYAIAVVCGTEYEEAYRVARAIRGKRHAKGITVTNLINSCKKFGVTGVRKELDKKMKLSKWLDQHTLPNKVYVVNTTRHFLIVDTRDWTTIDNQKPEWEAVTASKHINKMVHGHFIVDNPKFETAKDEWLFEPLAASSK